MAQADYPRRVARTRINALFNGAPPYSPKEVEENAINVNVNYLEGTRISHDARAQFYSAFLKPGLYFTATLDSGPLHKRKDWSAIVTREMNKLMKHSLPYYECFRSKFAMDVLHGIGPAAWCDSDSWCPDPIGVEDVLVPSNTLLHMKNLPFFGIHRSFTAPELIKLTRGPKVDPGWNLPLVEECIRYIDRETMALRSDNWPEMWSPEKIEERIKGDGGYYAGDVAPTIETYDFYFWNETKRSSGWKRRIVIDAWSAFSDGGQLRLNRKAGSLYEKRPQDEKGGFLYTSDARNFASHRESIINFQFADLSAVAPFRYHSVRSLGYLLFAVCHLQNRMRCKFTESVFEALMMYFRVKGGDDAQRVLKVELINKGFVDDTLQFIPPNERYQVNAQLVELGLSENRNLINENASSYRQPPDFSDNKTEKTKFQVMAELNSTTQLVGAAFAQAYEYQRFEYREIFRRFCKRLSADPDVRRFRAACLRQGVPEEFLQEERWEVEPERVMGEGNRTMELAIAQQLMQYRNLYDPDAQRQILRDVTLAVTNDPARANQLVPEQPQVSNSIHDAQLAAGALLQGLPVSIKSGINQTEYIETLIKDMAIVVQKIAQRDNVGTADELAGLQNMAQHITQSIQLVAQDPQEQPRAKQYQDLLGKLMNAIKGFAQRLQEKTQTEGQANGANGGPDPDTLAKIQALLITSQAKADNARESHAQRTAQRQVSFELQQKQKAQTHAQDLQLQEAQNLMDLKKQVADTTLELDRARIKNAASESPE